LESNLFNAGVRPAINIGISVSRVGGAAQTKIMKKVSGSAKLDLAQYYELAAFTQFASELDDATKRQLIRGERVVESMKQGVAQPFKLWEEVAILYAVSNGLFDGIAKDDVVARKASMLQRVAVNAPDLIKEIEKDRALTDAIKAGLDAAVRAALA
jgi:F-type H+-transporting ATPase subunit alpha